MPYVKSTDELRRAKNKGVENSALSPLFASVAKSFMMRLLERNASVVKTCFPLKRLFG